MSIETQGKMGVTGIALFTLCAVLVVDTLTASASIGVSAIGWWVLMLIFFVIPYADHIGIEHSLSRRGWHLRLG
ncbi:agmatine/putrescine antiporter [Vibrio sp. JCM 19236]|nr:agmatine/putrescine antiporter [Vibrio sp. JCM 19236]